jgi:hypothetical protein
MTRQRREVNGQPVPWLGDVSEPVAAELAELQFAGFEILSAGSLLLAQPTHANPMHASPARPTDGVVFMRRVNGRLAWERSRPCPPSAFACIST